MDFSSPLCQTFHKNKSRKDLSYKKNGRAFSCIKEIFQCQKFLRLFIDAQYTMETERNKFLIRFWGSAQ